MRGPDHAWEVGESFLGEVIDIRAELYPGAGVGVSPGNQNSPCAGAEAEAQSVAGERQKPILGSLAGQFS